MTNKTRPSDRDAPPDAAVRARRMPYLAAAHVLPLADAAMYLDLPLSTLDKLRATGRGPRVFRLGRRLYVRGSDLRTWLDAMAESEAT